MEITVGQQIYYSNREWVPAKEIGEALLALESTIQHSIPVLEKLFPGTQIESAQVFINELKSGSIYEDLIVKFVFGSQENLDEFIVNSRKKLGMDKLMSNPNIYSAIVIAILLGALAYEMGKDTNVNDSQKATIEANHNTFINIGSGMVDMTADDFRALLDGAVKDKAEVARNAVAITRPAKRDPQSSITFNNSSEIGFSNEIISATPNALNDSVAEQSMKDFSNLELEIRATDLDSGKKGWAVALPEFNDRRVRLQLDPSVNTDDLAYKRSIRGDVTVMFKADKYGRLVPNLVFLRAIVDPETSSD